MIYHILLLQNSLMSKKHPKIFFAYGAIWGALPHNPPAKVIVHRGRVQLAMPALLILPIMRNCDRKLKYEK